MPAGQPAQHNVRLVSCGMNADRAGRLHLPAASEAVASQSAAVAVVFANVELVAGATVVGTTPLFVTAAAVAAALGVATVRAAVGAVGWAIARTLAAAVEAAALLADVVGGPGGPGVGRHGDSVVVRDCIRRSRLGLMGGLASVGDLGRFRLQASHCSGPGSRDSRLVHARQALQRTCRNSLMAVVPFSWR